MEGDFSRDSFDPLRHFTRVLMQQGRVQLDADWNEQVAIAQHYLRALAADLIGPHGGPAGQLGFAAITDPAVVGGMRGKYGRPLEEDRIATLSKLLDDGDFIIGAGRYYVDGLLCENDEPLTYGEQPGYPFDEETSLKKLRGANQFLIYLDVWERHVAGTECDDLVEVALGGPDTATRSQLIWQVKILRDAPAPSCASVGLLRRAQPPLLRAAAAQPQDLQDPCVIDPAARYRGAENQLYRVEIHRGGTARPAGATAGGATFKWSRENGSVAFRIKSLTPEPGVPGTTTVQLASLGPDRRLGLAQENWVEVVDDWSTLRGEAAPLQMVERIDRDMLQVALSGSSQAGTGQAPDRNPLLRRWDHDASDPALSDEGALLVIETSSAASGWIDIEDGVQVQFPASATAGQPNEYQSGDYWLIPARTTTSDVIWPRHQAGDHTEWQARPSRAIEHHYAPLVVASISQSGKWTFEAPDCRKKFGPISG